MNDNKIFNSTVLMNSLNEIGKGIENLEKVKINDITNYLKSNMFFCVIIGGIFCLIAFIFSCIQIFYHLSHFNKKNEQMYIIRILLMVPIYCMFTWMTLCFPLYSTYLLFFQDCYEAYILYIFLQLLIQYLSGEEEMLNKIDVSNKRLNHFFPVNLFIFDCYILNRDVYKKIKLGVMQFTFIKPLTGLLQCILYKYDFYSEVNLSFKSGYVYIATINNISVSISLYCLGLFYFVFEKDLEKQRPFLKFFCIKLVIFFSYWQSFVLEVLVILNFFDETSSKIIGSLFLCFEMVVASIMQSFAFPHYEYLDYSYGYQDLKSKNIFSGIKSVINVIDIIDDAESTFKEAKTITLNDM